MAIFLRCLVILTAVVMLALLLTPTLQAARAQATAADITLFDAANRDRAAAGLLPLQWDAALAVAAHQHAQVMAQRNSLSHQFPGEPAMQDRARQAGARFSLIAENVAEGPTVTSLHIQWMNSPPHRANLLDPDLNAVGISVVQSGNMLFAVEDFSTAVLSLSLEEQEQQVASELAAHGLRAIRSNADARKTCALDRGWVGQRPASVVRYETADLSRLPDDIGQRLASGKYQSASVGACDSGRSSGFTRFRIAILLN